MYFVLLLSVLHTLTAAQNYEPSNATKNTTTTSTTTTTTTTSTTTSTTTISPAPAPTVPVYNVSNGTDICLLVQMNLKLGITYFNKKGEPLINNFYINSTKKYDVATSGQCGTDLESLVLRWWPVNQSNPSWSLGLQFRKRSDGHFSLDFMDFNYTTDDSLFPDTNDTSSSHFVSRNESQFNCPLGSYFQCMTQQTSKLTKASFVADKIVEPEVFITLSDLKAEAFRASNTPTFLGSMRECSADYVPNKVVPIVVGVALAAMIVIALITFVIGSRRRQHGYQEI